MALHKKRCYNDDRDVYDCIFTMWLIKYEAGTLIECYWLYIGDILLWFFSEAADYRADAEVKLPNNKTENGQANINGR